MWLLAALVSFADIGPISAGDALRIAEKERLHACMTKLIDAPGDAYEDGLAWLGEGGRPAAHHCTALALIELGHAAEGALRLEELASEDNSSTLTERITYLTQAGNAWLLARQPEAALLIFDNALRLKPKDAHLHADKAAAYMQMEEWGQALDYLDSALTGLGEDAAILKMRAEVLYQLGDWGRALGDVYTVMALDPEDIDILVIRGAVREAMRLQSLGQVAQPLRLRNPETRQYEALRKAGR